MEQKIDKNTKIFFIILILLIAYAVVASYYRFFIARDYQIIAEISCDPETESCFVYFDEESGEEYIYKKINKNASNILFCDPFQEGVECEELYCQEGEDNCEIIYCDPDEGDDCL